MKCETFDPRNYKSISDIPKPLQKNFANTLDDTGFVRKEVSEADAQSQKIARRRETLAKENFGREEEFDPMDITHEKSLKEHEVIENTYQMKITELEASLGQSLSDEAKKEIYQQIYAKHTDETITHEENKMRTEEQAVYKNELILQRSRDILKIPEEQLHEMPEAARLQLLEELSWNLFADKDSDSYPEEVLDAISHIYKTYTPSETLQLSHKNANGNVLDKIGDENFLSLEKMWENSVENERMEICKEWVKSLCVEYNMPEIPVEFHPRVGDSTISAQYNLGGGPDKLGAIALFGDINYSTLNQIFPRLSHETGHAFQEALQKNIVDGTPYQRDLRWFDVSKKWDGSEFDKKSFQASHKRYLSLPKENDTHLLQDWTSQKISQKLEDHKNRKLHEAGLSDIEIINLQEKIARWANNFLISHTEINGDDLVKIAQEKLTNRGPTLIEQWFKGKTGDECREIVKDLFESAENARRTLEVERT